MARGYFSRDDWEAKIPGPDYKEMIKSAKREVIADLAAIAQPDRNFQRRVRRAGADPDVLLDAVTGPFSQPDVVLVRAVGVIRQADAEIGAHVDDRDQALAHLWFYERRLMLQDTIGVTVNAYRQILAKALYGDSRRPLPSTSSAQELKEIAEAAGIPRIENAADKILEPAAIVAKARARREVGVRFMQEAVWTLSEPPYDWSPDKTAEHADITRKQVYNSRDAARRRHR
ncbi:hypothetical protein [Streptomyces longispororuber]|uniref:hypothetical protein n=1 Tax=Streptomyces longispororuber TaxID=68230 RepID=UPI0036F5A8C8